MIILLICGVASADASSKSEGIKITADSVRKSAITCYAIEGMYPDSLNYLEENYNLNINTDLYIVHYEIFASNIMPEITVTYRNEVAE